GVLVAALYATALSPVCFRAVSRVPQNGFVGMPRHYPRTLRITPVRRKLPPSTIQVRFKCDSRAREATIMKMTRRGLLGLASAAWASTVLSKPASAVAEFEFKLGVNTPDTH